MPPLAIVGAVNGAKLIAAAKENWDGRSLDFETLASSMRMAALRTADRFDVDQAARDALTEADAAMADHLVSCLPTREELVGLAHKGDLAATVASHVVDRLATHDPRFAEGALSMAGFDARSFAAAVVKDVITAALANNDYRQSLMTYLQIETLQGVARLEDGMAEILEFVRAQKMGASLTDQALRGAIARFIAFQPDASDAAVLNAVETFERDYRALLEQVSHISVHDNHIQSLKVAAEEALEAGDIATARTRYGEAAKGAADKASEPVRNAATLKSAEASAALTMLDWQAADAAWEEAATKLIPFDVTAGEAIVWEAADRLDDFGQIFAQAPALMASERRWRLLETAAKARSDANRAANIQFNLGAVLYARGEWIVGYAGLALLEEAVEACNAALTVFKLETMPAKWAIAQNNLGNALSAQGERMHGDVGLALLGQSVTAYRAALTIYTEAAMPVQWAMTQNNLGGVLFVQGERTGGEAGLALLAQAVDAYRAALTVRTKVAMSAKWAMTQNNLGNVLSVQGERIKGNAGLALLGQAVDAYRAALTLRTEAARPADWAITQNNLGNVLRVQGERTGGDAGLALLAQAVEAYRAALTVWTVEHFSYYHEMASYNLALVEAAIAARRG